jgi:hypothetical protein
MISGRSSEKKSFLGRVLEDIKKLIPESSKKKTATEGQIAKNSAVKDKSAKMFFFYSR